VVEVEFSTSVAFVMELEFLLVNATAMEMLPTNVAFVVEVEFSTSAAFAMELEFLLVNVTAVEMSMLNAPQHTTVSRTSTLPTMATVKSHVESW